MAPKMDKRPPKTLKIYIYIILATQSKFYASTLNRYIYFEEANLTGENVLAVLYCAKKYMVRGLETLCKDYLEKHMDQNNVCVILEQVLYVIYSIPFEIRSLFSLHVYFRFSKSLGILLESNNEDFLF